MRPLCLSSLLLAACIGLASVASADDATRFEPRGPGAVFATVEAAAIDGLAFAHREQRQSDNARLSRGGAIRAVAGGFTYDALVAGTDSSPDELTLVLSQDVVAHFHTYPKQNPSIDRLNESHSAADRAVVDELDRLARPSYVLTPSLRVVGYFGRDARSTVPNAVRAGRLANEVVVASLGRSGTSLVLASAR